MLVVQSTTAVVGDAWRHAIGNVMRRNGLSPPRRRSCLAAAQGDLQGADLVSTSARCLGTADLENKPRSRGTKQRAPWSRFPGVVTTSACNTMDVSSDFDQCASTGSPEQHGHPQRLLGCGKGHHLLALGAEVARGIGIDVAPGMIELARARLRSSSWRANLAFEVDDAEELEGIADQSIDPAICIGAFEHMLDKRAVLASIYRVLKLGGRFSARHLSSDRMLTHDDFSALLDQAGFRRIRSAPWTFIPRGDVPALVALLLMAFDAIGRRAGLGSLRGGLSLCAWKEAKPA